MTKRLICLLLATLLLLGCPLWAGAEGVESQFAIFVDGQEVTDAHAILENGVTYVSACNVARALVPDTTAAWAGGSAEMVLTGTGFTLSVSTALPYIVCNGRYLYTPGQTVLHPENGDLLLPVRVLARALGAPLGWDSYGVYMYSQVAPLESGETFYDANDLYLMARTIRHEAGNQPLEGQIAVGNVLLNRVNSRSFPGTLHGVIYQPSQFANSERSTPQAQHYIAAKLALDGAQIVPASCCWFNAAGKSFWGSRNKSLICTIGGQSFYG